MQLEIDERIEDATLRRQGPEAELTHPGRGWDGKVTDICSCEVGTFMRTASSVFCEPWAKDRSRPKLTVPHCVTWSSGRYRFLNGEGVCHDSSDSQLSLPQGLTTTPGETSASFACDHLASCVPVAQNGGSWGRVHRQCGDWRMLCPLKQVPGILLVVLGNIPLLVLRMCQTYGHCGLDEFRKEAHPHRSTPR